MTNCPNCGAPIKGHTCEYCGTTFGIDKAKGSDVLGINIYGVGPVSNLQRLVEEQQRLQYQNILASMTEQNNYIMSGFINSQNIIGGCLNGLK